MQRFLSVFRPNPSFSASVLSHEKTSNHSILSIKTNKTKENNDSYQTGNKGQECTNLIREDLRNIAIIAHVDHGKTTLVDMIREYVNNPSGTPVELTCDKKCYVLEGSLWKEQ